MPRLQVNAALPLDEKEDLAWEALMASNDARRPEVMRRGDGLVRMGAEGDLDPYSVPKLSRRVSQVAAFGTEAKEGSWRPKDPEKPVVLGLLDSDESGHPGAPRVERVTEVPTLTAGLDLVTEPGHHAEGRVFYQPAEGVEDVAPPDEITTEDVEEARDLLLLDYLGDFNFADTGSMSHALALLLLPFVREAVEGQTPLHVILAPDMGSGKTTLAQACLLPGCGVVPAAAGAADDSEWRKRITALLLAGRPAILLDNLTGELRSGPLAAALTSGRWQDRVLGESREVTLPVRNVWAITGNKLRMADDMIRRSVPIFLDPGEVRPSDRPASAFRHSDLLGWGQANRRELVRAALTLVEHWRRGAYHVEGGYLYVRSGDGPVEGKVTMGSYQSWAKVMGGILDSCGMPGFLTNRSRLKSEADERGEEIAQFLSAWHSLGLGPMPTAKLAEQFMSATVEGQPLRTFMPRELADKYGADDLKRALDYWVRNERDVWRGGFKLTTDGCSHRQTWWQVIPQAGHAAGPDDAAIGSAP